MRVLVLGVGGNVGSRLVPALLAHQHEVVGYVRSASKVPPEVSAKLTSVVVGSGTDSAGIKAAILAHNCNAVVNAAGLATITSIHKKGPLLEIFAAVVKAAVEARQERGGPPLRCWFMSGWTALDSPKQPYLIVDFLPLYPEHQKNYNLIKNHKRDDIAWSLFCASEMTPKYKTPQFPPPEEVSADNLVAKEDSPPDWKETFGSFPLVGTYLNILAQAPTYTTSLESCADFMAADLENGLKSEWIGRRVGVKEKAKAA